VIARTGTPPHKNKNFYKYKIYFWDVLTTERIECVNIFHLIQKWSSRDKTEWSITIYLKNIILFLPLEKNQEESQVHQIEFFSYSFEDNFRMRDNISLIPRLCEQLRNY